MFPFGPTELLILLLVVLIIFGAGKLPKAAQGLAQSIRDFRENLSSGPSTGSPAASGEPQERK